VCVSPAETECVVASATPSKWADGQVSGYVYDFVTWHTDNNCGLECKKQENYKRITVVVTVKVPGGTHEPQRIRISTFLAGP